MNRRTAAAALAASLVLTACDVPSQLPPNPAPIGDFRLGYITTSAEGSVVPDLSREIPHEEMESFVNAALRERLGRYKGDKWYHLSVAVEGYVLAPPGIPVIASPRSGMVLRIVVWDDAAGVPLNDPHSLTVTEPVSPETVVGSGYSRTAKEQAVTLSRFAASVLEDWLKSSEESPLPGVGPSE